MAEQGTPGVPAPPPSGRSSTRRVRRAQGRARNRAQLKARRQAQARTAQSNLAAVKQLANTLQRMLGEGAALDDLLGVIEHSAPADMDAATRDAFVKEMSQYVRSSIAAADAKQEEMDRTGAVLRERLRALSDHDAWSTACLDAGVDHLVPLRAEWARVLAWRGGVKDGVQRAESALQMEDSTGETESAQAREPTSAQVEHCVSA